MEVAKLAAPPNLEVRLVSCNESAIKRWLSSELEETVFSLSHELFMSKHHTVTLSYAARASYYGKKYFFCQKIPLVQVIETMMRLRNVQGIMLLQVVFIC